ncbi:unnamed protein product [Nyctereutes procyonoides]|uniref:(raccoon dog) hypothetical protein n=1 Tax=Nyctereutes procyonoides TaxID=34880 RepID=A0A811ZZQ9_NYCPR|nr:unnamed protein product [Nyctereutes procyonoides]
MAGQAAPPRDFRPTLQSLQPWLQNGASVAEVQRWGAEKAHPRMGVETQKVYTKWGSQERLGCLRCHFFMWGLVTWVCMSYFSEGLIRTSVAVHKESSREREREAETQAEGEAGSMHREPDVGFDPGSPGSRPGPKAGAKPLRHPGIPRSVFLKKQTNACTQVSAQAFM